MVINNRWVTLCYSHTARNMLRIGWAYWDRWCLLQVPLNIVTSHILPELDTCTHILLWYYRIWTASFANPCPTIAMQSLDTGDQEDRVWHCVIQPAVLLLSFHVAATGEDNQTDDPLLEIAFLYSASVGPPFHWCYVQHRLALPYSVQWEHNRTRSTENCMHLPPPAIVLPHTDILTCHCTTYTREYFHWIKKIAHVYTIT